LVGCQLPRVVKATWGHQKQRGLMVIMNAPLHQDSELATKNGIVV